MGFVPPSGRVAVYPIYKSTHERVGQSCAAISRIKAIFWRDHVVMWVKDYRRTLDYLSTRADIDTTKFAYFGFSWGGYMGGIIPAVEKRIKVSMLYVAGLTMERARPEVEPINYLPRIKSPRADAEREVRLLLPERNGAEAVLRTPRLTRARTRSGCCTRAATMCHARS